MALFKTVFSIDDVTWDTKVEESQFKASTDKVSRVPYMKNKPKSIELEFWVKW
jgi:hypothetical protein